eukprot:11142860-Alexandrium_andersonii.AAC.1
MHPRPPDTMQRSLYNTRIRRKSLLGDVHDRMRTSRKQDNVLRGSQQQWMKFSDIGSATRPPP